MLVAKKKLYCYVDETGQDTAGRFFAVGVLVTEAEQEKLRRRLAAIEKQSSKGIIKWHKALHRYRAAYVAAIAHVPELRHALFVAIYRDSKEYLNHIADAIAKVLRHKRGDRAIVYVDALRDSEQQKLKRQLHPSVRIPIQVRGIRKDENSAFIRLVDAICGLIRDADEGNAWAKKMVQKLKRKGIVEAL